MKEFLPETAKEAQKRMSESIPDPSDLSPLSQSDLDHIIEKHAMYMKGRHGGARAVVTYSNLSYLDFKKSDLSFADFTGSLFLEADLSNSNFTGTSFFAGDLRNANMSLGNFSRADFRGAYVAGADLTGANLKDADMREGKIMKRGEKGTLTDRKRSGGIGAKTVFTGAKLTDTNMAGIQAKAADFSDADLTGANMTGTDLGESILEGANLTDVDMTGSNLAHANMKASIITGTIMNNVEKQGLNTRGTITEKDMGSKLENLGKTLPKLLEEHTLWVATAGRAGRQLDLSGYDLHDVLNLKSFPLTAIRAMGANFLNQDLQEAELQSAVFDRSDFRDCKMMRADLRGSSFKYANFSRTDLTKARLCPLEFHKENEISRLQRTDLSGTNLRYASLRHADLRDCILMGVDLTGAALHHCDLRRADLTGAILKGAIFENARLDGALIDTDAL